jgi:hypothetical protein
MKRRFMGRYGGARYQGERWVFRRRSRPCGRAANRSIPMQRIFIAIVALGTMLPLAAATSALAGAGTSPGKPIPGRGR